MSQLHIVILAAGRGTRMRSRLPKVIQPVAGKPLLGHVLDGAAPLGAAATHIVYGYGGDQVRRACPDPALHWAEQAEQLGTGHAVMQALPQVPDNAQVLVLYGDVPLVRTGTLEALVEAAGTDAVGLLTVMVADPAGYGRILRNDAGGVRGIVEHKDASAEQQLIREVNTGLLCAPAKALRGWLNGLSNENAQGEYYLTDIVAMAAAAGTPVRAVQAGSEAEVAGVNDRLQLAAAERQYALRQAETLMRAGVRLADPARFDLRGRCTAGEDVFIDVNAVLEGDVTLGDRVQIGPNCLIRNARIGAGTVVHANTVIEDAEVGPDCQLGPFARLRPGTVLAGDNKLGNFVETKQATLGHGSKAGHLAYLGDATIGARVNVSAGVITCNYDGANKHQTVVGDDAFIGTDSQLVAPVTVGDRAYIAAGSTITKTAPDDALTICRARGQRSIDGWKQPVKSSAKGEGNS